MSDSLQGARTLLRRARQELEESEHFHDIPRLDVAKTLRALRDAESLCTHIARTLETHVAGGTPCRFYPNGKRAGAKLTPKQWLYALDGSDERPV